MYVTPRTLLAIIRLAQALAKMNFRNVVKQLDVDEVLRLMEYSIRSLREIAGGKKSRSQARQGHENEDR